MFAAGDAGAAKGDDQGKGQPDEGSQQIQIANEREQAGGEGDKRCCVERQVTPQAEVGEGEGEQDGEGGAGVDHQIVCIPEAWILPSRLTSGTL